MNIPVYYSSAASCRYHLKADNPVVIVTSTLAGDGRLIVADMLPACTQLAGRTPAKALLIIRSAALINAERLLKL